MVKAIPEYTVCNLLFERLFGKHTGKTTPFLILENGKVISHAAFLAMAGQFANTLKTFGVTPGDRVACQIAKSPEMLALYAACVQSGAVFLPLNTAYTANEISYFLTDSSARLFLCDDSQKGTLAPIAAAAGALLEALNADGTGSFAEAAAGQPVEFETAARQPTDLAALLYTSGTTGRSKGAMLSQNNLLSNAETLAGLWEFSSHDVLLHALPIFHTHGLFVATNVSLVAGGSMYFLPKFDIEHVLAALPKVTSMMGVPTFYTRLLDEKRFNAELTSKMRLFISGSAPLLAETHAAFLKRTGHVILERYGMTETNMNTSNPYLGERRGGTVGPALPGVDVIITHPETGETMPVNTIGQIEVRGPNVFAGYWQQPEKTAEDLRANGFFKTGDLGKIDEKGYVEIVGRMKDLIISGGFNIYPKEVEMEIDAIDGVEESAVFGLPDPDLGEIVTAAIVLKADADLSENAIVTRLSTKLARYKQPRKIIFVPDLPRNTMGKVQKNVLRQTYSKS